MKPKPKTRQGKYHSVFLQPDERRLINRLILEHAIRHGHRLSLSDWIRSAINTQINLLMEEAA